MRRIALTGVNALGESVKLGKDVAKFTGHSKNIEDGYYSVIRSELADTIELVTPNHSYLLKKHRTENYYFGDCAGRKVKISLKKIVGEIRF